MLGRALKFYFRPLQVSDATFKVLTNIMTNAILIEKDTNNDRNGHFSARYKTLLGRKGALKGRQSRGRTNRPAGNTTENTNSIPTVVELLALRRFTFRQPSL